jgi:quercetin dioxygenase-like cupin family protein
MVKVVQDKGSSKGRYDDHKKKMGTVIVIEGELVLDIADEKGTTTEYILTPYESIRVKPGTKHRFTFNNNERFHFFLVVVISSF